MQKPEEVELKRKFGFKQTREEREKAVKDEKRQKWQQKLEKESIQKLEKELDSMQRAGFLAPQQKERKRLVERMLGDLLRQRAEAEAEALAEKHAQQSSSEALLASKPKVVVDSDSDDGEDRIFGVSITQALSGAADVEGFVPRSVKVRKTEKLATERREAANTAKEVEQELLSALSKEADNLDEFLDSL